MAHSIVYRIPLRNTSDTVVSEVLQADEQIKNVAIDLEDMGGGWDRLLSVISTYGNLEEVSLDDAWGLSLRNPPAVSDRFLQAIQRNPATHTMRLNHLRLSGTAIASFLDAATSVTTFSLESCAMEASESMRGGQDLAASLQRNTNIRRLSLEGLDEILLLPILESLASNSHVKELALEPMAFSSISIAASNAMRRLMESTTTIIERLELGQCLWNEEAFRPIAEGLINSGRITDIKFDGCAFDDEGSRLLFKSILQSKSNLRSLSLRNLSVCGQWLPATYFTNLLQPDSSLRSFEISHVFTDNEFAPLLGLVEKSKLLEQFVLDVISHEKCQALIASIPKMQVRTLTLGLGGNLWHLKSDLIAAVKRNASLRTVITGDLNGGDLLNEIDKRKLNSYAARNEDLAQWIASPAMIPRKAWAKALETALVTGPDTVFRILLGIVASIGPIEGERCRKRQRLNPP